MPKFKNGEYAWDSLNKCKVVVCVDVLEGQEYLVFPVKGTYNVLYAIDMKYLKPLQHGELE